MSTCMAAWRWKGMALLKLKGALTDPSGRLSSWVWVREDCCSWRGIDPLQQHDWTCGSAQSPDDPYIDPFAAYEESTLDGKVNHSLLNLKFLNHLDFSGNDVGGIPPKLHLEEKFLLLNLEILPA
uniref:Leucine-rich repeat-containing N-terminal plant-type domain-containing protein n=1 Tax=Nelumbo nucifera TaxID=4432 RepID=A0A822XYC1_NELNU|nr:TPA_asm: hypothetical protein HUJ06_026476 [Nelumbo nucifera]